MTAKASTLQNKIQLELKKEAGVSIVDLVNSLVEHAYSLRASDIRITPTKNDVRVRLRIDGVLQDVFTIPSRIHNEVVSRIKIFSSLRTDEHQAAQDGRFRIDIEESGPVDIRVSITPTYHGQNIVLRILSDKAEEHSLETLGFSEKDRETLLKAIKRPFGMILSTGPTGSGKTTTLYTLMKRLNNPDVSIITIEDPIEYAVENIEQIQVNPRTNLTFANGLRSVMSGTGCDHCNGSGYHGRIGINEILVVDDAIREAFLRKASASEIRKLAMKNGMTPMIVDGVNKAADGITTLEEILRVIHE